MTDIATCLVGQSASFSGHAEGQFQFPPLPLLLLGMFLFGYGFTLYRRYRRLQDTPRIAARSVAMGFVHVRGKAAGGEVLVSPLMKVPCYHYSSLIEIWVRGGNKWSRVHGDSNFCNFYVDDGTGRVLVDTSGAKFDLQRIFQGTIGRKGDDIAETNRSYDFYIDPTLGVLAPTEADLLRVKREQVARIPVIALFGSGNKTNKVDLDAKAFPDDARYRFTEICLPAGHEVSVFGTCKEDKNSTAVNVIVKDDKDKILLITSNPDAKVEAKLRPRAVIFVAWGALLLFLSFASCRPTFTTASGTQIHSSK